MRFRLMLLNIGITLRGREVLVRGLPFNPRLGTGIIESTMMTSMMKIIVPISRFSFCKYTKNNSYDKEVTKEKFR